MKRNSALDVVKCVAVMAVVLIHATSPIGIKGIDTFWNYDWYRSLLNFAVPFFYAAAGFVLYGKTVGRSDGNAYVWRYALNILAYYVTATLLYLAFGVAIIAANRVFLDSSVTRALAKLMGNLTYVKLINGTIGWYHLYFLAMLFGGCLILIALRRLKLNPTAVLVVGSVLYLMSLIGYIRIDSYFVHGGILRAFFYLALGYFVSSLDPKTVRGPGLGLAVSAGVYYVCSLKITSIAVLPLVFVTGYLVALCAKYPTFGEGSMLAKWGTMSLEIFIFHDMARVLIERVFVYAGVTSYYQSPWYYLVAIPFSFFFPLVIFRFTEPLFRWVRFGRERGAAAVS